MSIFFRVNRRQKAQDLETLSGPEVKSAQSESSSLKDEGEEGVAFPWICPPFD